MARYIARCVQWFTATELTVLSFILASLVGGLALWYTEYGRTVHAMVPSFYEVSLVPTDAKVDNIPAIERHVRAVPTQYSGETFIDAWFTAVSALCVTGLVSTDFSQFTLAGQIITLILIQMGGLGIIVFTTFLALAFYRGLSDRFTFRNLLSSILDTGHDDVKDMLKYVFVYTAAFEIIGTVIMGIHLQWNVDPDRLAGANPWWWALFHAVSAYNNAGFSLMNNNLMNFVTDPVINLTIAGLIILGGIGYPVLIFLYAMVRKGVFRMSDKEQEELTHDVSGVSSVVQLRVAIVGTILLLVIGTGVGMYVERDTPGISSYSWSEQLMIAFFQSTSTRTAGFNTVDIGALHITTLILYMALMYIGANPAGTAGGIKIPTVAVLYGYVKDWFHPPGHPVVLLGRRVSKFALAHAIRLFFFSMLFIGVIVTLITYIEKDYLLTPDPTFNFTKVLFEVVSAFGTVGLSMGFSGGVTSFSAILQPSSKFLLIVTMFFGRIGPLTMLAALPWKRAHLSAPESKDFSNVEKIQIG